MQTLNIHEAKTHLSRWLAKVEKGAEVIIARDGKPVARLVPYSSRKGDRLIGKGKGAFTMTKDFDKPLSDKELALFEK